MRHSLLGRRDRRPVVLAYHRVARAVTDPQLLSVTPEHFAEHLELLRARYEPARLGELGTDSVAVTFDDGYADTLLEAKPLLERARVPTTVFVTTGYVGNGRRFWWDELERLLLRPGRLPPMLDLAVAGELLRWELGDDATYAGDERLGWNVLDDGEPGPRQRAYRDLCARLRRLDDAERERVIDALAAAAEPEADELARPLTSAELRELAESELVEIGAHTVTHPVLAQLPPDRQQDEIAGSRRELEDVLGRSVTSFAYPYGGPGDFDETTVSLVRDAGFDCACSTFAGRVDASTDVFRVPRVVVRDWSGEELERVLAQAR
jgi:peptidoglycan/xylan/chitin deacetylase (PgdA/CDA1 family)